MRCHLPGAGGRRGGGVGRGAADQPAGGERRGGVCALPGQDRLAGRPGGAVSASGPLAGRPGGAGGAAAGGADGGGAVAGAAQPVCGGGLAVVSGHAGAGDRPGAGGVTIDGGPLHLPAVDRARRGGRLVRGSTRDTGTRVAARGRCDHQRAAPRARRALGPAGRRISATARFGGMPLPAPPTTSRLTSTSGRPSSPRGSRRRA